MSGELSVVPPSSGGGPASLSIVNFAFPASLKAAPSGSLTVLEATPTLAVGKWVILADFVCEVNSSNASNDFLNFPISLASGAASLNGGAGIEPQYIVPPLTYQAGNYLHFPVFGLAEVTADATLNLEVIPILNQWDFAALYSNFTAFKVA